MPTLGDLLRGVIGTGWNPDVQMTGVRPDFGLGTATAVAPPAQSDYERTLAPGQERSRDELMGMLAEVILSGAPVEGMTSPNLARPMTAGMARRRPRTESIPKAVRWDEIRHGQPATINVFRGTGGASTPLSAEQRSKFGRDFLLGEGLYVTPSKQIASNYGTPEKMAVTLKNPYVLEQGDASSLRGLDPQAIRAAGYDGIIVKRGKWGHTGEDLKQAVVFPEAGAGILSGHLPPAGLDKGVVVRVERVHGGKNPSFRAAEREAVGGVGKVTSLDAWGNPTVRIGGKLYRFNADEVTITGPT